MQLPQWAIDLALPAQRYLRRRQQVIINEHRRQHPLAEAKRISENEARQAPPQSEAVQARRRQMRDQRLQIISSIADERGDLLRATAEDLERTGSGEIRTAGGEISARLIRFRWGPDVLDITRTRDGRHAGWSLDYVPRSPVAARAKAITWALAKALAALEPLAPS